MFPFEPIRGSAPSCREPTGPPPSPSLVPTAMWEALSARSSDALSQRAALLRRRQELVGERRSLIAVRRSLLSEARRELEQPSGRRLQSPAKGSPG